jgi:hypothetical protein
MAKQFCPLARSCQAVERSNPPRIPLVMAKWWGEGFESLHGESLKRFDKYPEDVVMVLIEPFAYERMNLPWELKLTGAHDTRCVLDDWAKLDEFIAHMPDPEQDPQFEWAAEAASAEDRYFISVGGGCSLSVLGNPQYVEPADGLQRDIPSGMQAVRACHRYLPGLPGPRPAAKSAMAFGPVMIWDTRSSCS